MSDPFAPPSRARSRVGPWFDASYDSECNGCFDQIYEGERARYVDSEVVCEDCGEAEES